MIRVAAAALLTLSSCVDETQYDSPTWVAPDAGIVELPNGRSFVLVALVVDEAAGDPLVQPGARVVAGRVRAERAAAAGGGPGRDVDQEAEAAELSDHLRIALTRLPARQAEAFCLRWLEGMSYEEIATTMECPVGTVRSRILTSFMSLATSQARSAAPTTPIRRSRYARSLGSGWT